jgi:hypothetical protein
MAQKFLSGLNTNTIQITGGTPAIGKILTSDASGNGAWQSVAGTVLSTVTKTSSYTLTTADDIVLTDASSASFVTTLPSAVGMTKRLTIKKIDKNNTTITIVTVSSQTIDGNNTIILRYPNQSITLVSNGTNWVSVDTATVSSRTVYASDFGANGDAIIRTDGVTTLNNATFTSSTGTFSSTDIGKTLQIKYGSANATLSTALVSGATTTSLAVTPITNSYASGLVLSLAMEQLLKPSRPLQLWLLVLLQYR